MTPIEATTPTLRDGDVAIWLEHIGPARAEQLLKTYNTDYRKYRPTYAEGLARDMASTHWIFDGAPIKIDVNGNLFDGQHRLNAIILSGTTQKFLMISGLPVVAYNTTDTGLARNYGDTLRRRGYRNVLTRQALVKLIAKYEANKSYDDTRRLTTSELDEVHDKYVDSISRVLEMAISTRGTVEMPLSLICISWWVLRNIDEEKSFTFMVSLCEGTNIKSGNPILTLRNKLYRNRDIKLTRNEYMHLVYVAWNAWLAGNEIHTINLPGTLTYEKVERPLSPSDIKALQEETNEEESQKEPEV